MDIEQVYTVRDLAKALKVSQKTAYRMLIERRITGVKISNRWRVRASDLDTFLKRNTHKATK